MVNENSEKNLVHIADLNMKGEAKEEDDFSKMEIYGKVKIIRKTKMLFLININSIAEI
jgi:hypothetical protein